MPRTLSAVSLSAVGLFASHASGQTSASVAERWSFDAPTHLEWGPGEWFADYRLYDPARDEVAVDFSETAIRGPLTSETAAWLIEPGHGPTIGARPQLGPCELTEELFEESGTRVFWIACRRGGPFAALEHADGRFLVVAAEDRPWARELVRSGRARPAPNPSISDGWTVFHPAPGHDLMLLRRGTLEGFDWIGEVAPPGRREVVITIATGTGLGGEGPPDDAKVRFRGRSVRASRRGTPFGVSFELRSACSAGPLVYAIRGEAASGASFARLLALLATATPGPAETPDCALEQPSRSKSDERGHGPGGAWLLGGTLALLVVLAIGAWRLGRGGVR